MDLTLEELTDMLNVSSEAILQWVREGKIPFYRLNNEYRFNRGEIEGWMLSHDQTTDVAFRRKKPLGTQAFSLYRAIHRGGVYADIQGQSKQEVIREVSERLSQRFSWDSQVVSELLLDRERLMPTALSNGVAVPHTRDFLLDTHFDIVSLVFLQNPIEYGALDKQPVHTLFFLFACEDKRHLHLLAKVAHLSSQKGVLDRLKLCTHQDQVLELIKEWEAHLGSDAAL